MTTPTFADLGVSAAVVDVLAERKIIDAFPIQSASIEAALAGRDICGKAPTGSGKTLAFGVPIVELVERGTENRPRALILAPTRELATQIKDELEPLAEAKKRSVLTVFGGTNIERDIHQLRRGVDILVACPGRLEDLIARHCCNLRDVDLVVVDEADRMADMGFLPSVKRILDQTADNCHTMLYSATLDGDVDMLIKRYQTDPLTVEVDDQAGDIGDVEHSWYLVQPNDRIESAVAVLRRYYSSIVFCRTRRGCDRVAKTFASKGLDAVAIHGDRTQSQRERALDQFTSGRAQVLVATDVAARGIHVDSVALVMHYDPAGSDKDYIHRSGRTGRAGQDGRVVSMVVEDKKKIARQLQKDLGFKPGFDTFDRDTLPPVVERKTPPPEPKAKSKRPDDRFSDSRGSNPKSNQQRSRNNNRDGGRGRGRKSDDRDRDERGRGRSGKSGSSGDSDRGRGRSGKDGDSDQRRSRPKPRRTNDWYPPGYDDESRPSGGRKKPASKRKGSSGSSKRPGDREDKPPGGSGTKPAKSRAAKGRHADKGRNKDKGKRRK